MKYLLDTNVVIRLLNSDPVVTARTRQHDRDEMGMSAIVLHELMFGAFKSLYPERNLGFLDELDFDALDFQRRDAREAGRIRAALVARGTPIGPYDILIAGQALARDLILVTHNTREFSRVPGLKVEDWEA